MAAVALTVVFEFATRIEPGAVRLDVTRQDQINAAVAMIEKEGRGLWGVVNNAGVNVVAPMDAITKEVVSPLLVSLVPPTWKYSTITSNKSAVVPVE